MQNCCYAALLFCIPVEYSAELRLAANDRCCTFWGLELMCVALHDNGGTCGESPLHAGFLFLVPSSLG